MKSLEALQRLTEVVYLLNCYREDMYIWQEAVFIQE